MKIPMDGKFLVRKSSDANAFVCSLVFGGRVFHNKVQHITLVHVFDIPPFNCNCAD